MKDTLTGTLGWADYYLDPGHLISDPNNEGVKRKIVPTLFEKNLDEDSIRKAMNKIACDFMTLGHALHGANFGWFGDAPVAYARADDKARFILAIGLDQNAQATLIVVSINEEHNFTKSKETNSLANNTFKIFIKKHTDALIAQEIVAVKSKSAMFQLSEAAHLKLAMTEEEHVAVPLSKSRKKDIVFSEKQQRILAGVGSKVLLGGPGTGKTLVGVAQVVEMEAAAPTDSTKPLITFIQPKKALVEQTKKLYQEQRLVDKKSLVEFTTYEGWVRPFFDEEEEVDFLAFDKWLQKTGYAVTFNQKDKRCALYSEMQIAAGYLNPSMYLEAGERSTRLSKEEGLEVNKKTTKKTSKQGKKNNTARATVLEIYEAYREELAKNKQVDFLLCAPSFPQEMFSEDLLMVVDEFQDIPLTALSALMAHPNLLSKIMLLGDHQQKTDENASISFISFLKQTYFAAAGVPLKVETLSENYRCPKAIVEYAQVFLNIKLSIDEGTNSKEQYTMYTANENNPPGKVIFQHSISFKNLPFDTAVIVANQTTQEALQQAYPDLFVLMASEVKGLEFENVITYHLLDDPELAEVEEYLKNCVKKADGELVDVLMTVKNQHRTKDKTAPIQNNDATRCLNKVCAVLTRSKGSLKIIEPKNPRHPYLQAVAKKNTNRVMKKFSQFESEDYSYEESKENDVIESLANQSVASQSLETEERKLKFEKQVAALIEQGQFVLAEKYAWSNKQWHPDFDMIDFVNDILLQSKDGSLRLLWELKTLLPKLSKVDMEGKKELLQLSQEKKYEVLFKRIAKLAQSDKHAIPILVCLIEQAKVLGLVINNIQMPTGHKGKKNINAVDYILNMIKNAKDHTSADILKLQELLISFKTQSVSLGQSRLNFEDPECKEQVTQNVIPDKTPDVAPKRSGNSAFRHLRNNVSSKTSSYTHPVFQAIRQGDFLKLKSLVTGNIELIHKIDKGGFTPLHEACKQGHPSMVEFLIKNGADINQKDDTNATALFIASLGGHYEIVCFLLEQKNIQTAEKVNGLDGKKGSAGTALHAAIRNGSNYTAIVEKLLQNDNTLMNIPIELGITPFHRAVDFGSIDTVKLFIKNKVNVNRALDNGQTPIFYAAARGDIALLKVLWRAGANIHYVSPRGETAINNTIQSEFTLDVIKFFVEKGANVNQIQHNGVTALFRAAQNGNEEAVRYLLKAGANTQISVITSKDDLLVYISKQTKEIQKRIKAWMKTQVKSKDTYYVKPDDVADMMGYSGIASLIRAYRPNPYTFYPRERSENSSLAELRGFNDFPFGKIPAV
ncbi:MAG: ankyrin repeat domain-containing protein [Legionella sp.]|nr:ankyrin repeat domain-containing protein [Legionella sp.]